MFKLSVNDNFSASATTLASYICGYNPLLECFTWFKKKFEQFNQSDIANDSVNESSAVRQQKIPLQKHVNL